MSIIVDLSQATLVIADRPQVATPETFLLSQVSYQCDW
jgi:hypothetical protein